jgi:hypothetical protein
VHIGEARAIKDQLQRARAELLAEKHSQADLRRIQHGNRKHRQQAQGRVATKHRSTGGATKAQQKARRKFIAESPEKPTRDGLDAVRRELYGE